MPPHARATIAYSLAEDTMWLRLEKSSQKFLTSVPGLQHKLTNAQADFFFTAQEHAATEPDELYPHKMLCKPFSIEHWRDWQNQARDESDAI